MTTAANVAEWMVEELRRVRFLYQDVVVTQIRERFGDEFAYINENGNAAIDRAILAEFRKLTGDDVVWERGERLWRFRESYDPPGRMAE